MPKKTRHASPRPDQRRGNPARRPRATAAIRRGTLVYHGTSVAEEFEELEGPAWVSRDRAVAERFVRWHEGPRPRIITYRVLSLKKLRVFRSTDDITRFVERAGYDPDDGAAPHDLARIVCDAGYDGWVSPDNYGARADDIMLCDPESDLEFVRSEPAPPPAEVRPNPPVHAREGATTADLVRLALTQDAAGGRSRVAVAAAEVAGDVLRKFEADGELDTDLLDALHTLSVDVATDACTSGEFCDRVWAVGVRQATERRPDEGLYDPYRVDRAALDARAAVEEWRDARDERPSRGRREFVAECVYNALLTAVSPWMSRPPRDERGELTSASWVFQAAQTFWERSGEPRAAAAARVTQRVRASLGRVTAADVAGSVTGHVMVDTDHHRESPFDTSRDDLGDAMRGMLSATASAVGYAATAKAIGAEVGSKTSLGILRSHEAWDGGFKDDVRSVLRRALAASREYSHSWVAGHVARACANLLRMRGDGDREGVVLRGLALGLRNRAHRHVVSGVESEMRGRDARFSAQRYADKFAAENGESLGEAWVRYAVGAAEKDEAFDGPRDFGAVLARAATKTTMRRSMAAHFGIKSLPSRRKKSAVR